MMTPADAALYKNIASHLLDREFDKVGRKEDGEISDAAVERYGFRWAVGQLVDMLGVDRDRAAELAKAIGWY